MSSTRRTLTHDEYLGIGPKCQRRFDVLQEIMGRIDQARKVLPAIKDAAASLQGTLDLSAERLRTIYYAWRKHGELALVDHNLCGGKCRLPGCSHRVSTEIPHATLEEWLKKVEDNDRPAFRDGWKLLIKDLADGVLIPGIGTWRTLWAQENPHKPVPARCPWSIHRPPFGWSYQSFLNKRPPGYETLMGKKGLWHATNAMSTITPVRTDLSGLRFMEVVVFDDHRIDFKCWVGKQIVELWGVFAMDLATRTILAWGIRPRLETDDGTKQSITRRDMQHLIAGMLGTHGYPINWTCTLLVENAAAAVSTEVEKMLIRATSGQVIIDRTSVGSGTTIGFAEKYGCPRGKRWLESWFGFFETQIGMVKGQMGNRWDNQRGDFQARQNLGIKLARMDIMEQLPDLAKPFHDLEQARGFIHDGILRTENREMHDLAWFDDARFWRESEHDVWKPCDSGLFPQLPLELQNQYMSNDLTGLVRKETPAERREKLFFPELYQRVSATGMGFLLLDFAAVPKYKGGDCITHDHCGRTYDWAGNLSNARIGQPLVVRFDADRPTHCIIEDAEGRVLGAMRNRKAPSYFEKEALVDRLGERQKALGKALHNTRVRHADRDTLMALDSAVEIVTASLPQAKKVAKSDDSIDAAVLSYSKAIDAPDISSAEAYLAQHQSRDIEPDITPTPSPELEPETEEEHLIGPGW